MSPARNSRIRFRERIWFGLAAGPTPMNLIRRSRTRFTSFALPPTRGLTSRRPRPVSDTRWCQTPLRALAHAELANQIQRANLVRPGRRPHPHASDSAKPNQMHEFRVASDERHPFDLPMNLVRRSRTRFTSFDPRCRRRQTATTRRRPGDTGAGPTRAARPAAARSGGRRERSASADTRWPRP